MSNAIVSVPAFFKVELLSRRYLVVCEVVDEVGRIDPFVYAESEFRSSYVSRVYDRVVRVRKVDNRVTHLQRGIMPDVQAGNGNNQQAPRSVVKDGAHISKLRTPTIDSWANAKERPVGG